MHPLTKLLFEEGHFSGHRKPIEAEKVITTYLKGRAKWLKEKWVEQGNWHKAYTYDHIDTAFELSEKCEHIYPEDFRCGGCGHCPACEIYLKEKTLKPSLPSKINISEGSYGEMRAINTINEIIDFLHSKEAREG